MIINATFKGKDGSLGYRNGQQYTLVLRDRASVSIRRTDGTGLCPYASLSAFLRNWDVIKAERTEQGVVNLLGTTSYTLVP